MWFSRRPTWTNRKSNGALRRRSPVSSNRGRFIPFLERLEDFTLLSTSIPLSPSAWTPLGPAPIQSVPPSPGNAATGRISAIAADPTNGNVIYVGAASGGVWKTTNGGQTWFPLTDSQATLNIGSIALAPSNHNLIYVGTGEGNFSSDIGSDTIPGQGVLKSTDGGASWTLLGQSQFAGKSISAIVVNPTNPNTVYLTVDWGSPAGIWRSLDGGTTWTNVALPGASMTGLVMDPTNSQILYAAAGWFQGNSFNGVYRSTDGGTTWSFAGNFPTNSNGHVGRISLAIARSAPGTLYAAIADPANGQQVYQVMKTTNGNTPNPANISWVSVGNAATFQGDQLFHGQGFYGNVIIVDPFNVNNVFVAGYKVWQSTNGGSTWTKDPNTPVKIHDDQHAFAFLLPNDAANHRLLVGTDGGIYRLDNPGNFTFSDLNGTGMQITQFYHVGLDPTTADIAYGASQDNGVEKFQNSTTWPNELCCDGFNVEVSATNHNRVYANMNGTFFRSDNGGTNYMGLATPNGSRNDLYSLDPSNGDRVLMGGNAVYESTNAGASWTARNGTGWPANAGVEGIAVAPTTPNMIYVLAAVNGTTGTYVTTNDGQSWTHFNSPGNDGDFWSTGLQVDPLNNQLAYALNHSAGRVYRTTNGGQTWSNITGNLPSEPSFSLAVKSNGPADADKILYVGNDTGVYATYNMGSWSRLSTGLPNAHVTHVEVHPNLNVLAAGTYGRGLWELQVGVKAFVQNGTLVVQGDDGPNLITLQTVFLPPPLGLSTEVWEGNSVNPFNHLVALIPINSFNRIEVDGLGGNDTINIQDTTGGKPVTVNLGNGTDTVNISPSTHNLDSIGTVTVNGGQGIDTLNVFDQSNSSNTTYSLNNGRNVIVRSAPGGTATINYSLINGVNLNGGGGTNRYDVFNTSVFSPGTVVHTGNGNDAVNVRATTGALTVNGDGGPTTVTVGSQAPNLNGTLNNVSGPVTVTNTARGVLNVDASGDTTARSGTVGATAVTGFGMGAGAAVNYTGSQLSSLTLRTGSGGVAATVSGTSTSTSVIGNASGTNTLLGPNAATTWNVTGNNAGNLAGFNLTFSGFRNLTGGSVADTFVFSNGASVSGTVNGGGGANALNLAAYTTPVTVNLQAGTASGVGAFANVQSFIGGTAANTLIGPNAATTWNFSGVNAGSVAGDSFAAFQNLTGGAGDNLFVFADGAGVSGTITGGAGNNTLDYSLYTTPVTVGLQAGVATGVGAFVNVLNFIGGGAANTLGGPAAATTWNVAGTNAGSLSGGYTFSSFQNLVGGAGDNTFVFGDGAALTGTLTGGFGNNILDTSAYSSDESFSVTGVNAGAAGVVPMFGGIQNLVGGGAATTFSFSDGGSLSGSLTGTLSGSGTATLDYSNGWSDNVVVDLQTGLATGVGGGGVNVQNVNGASGGGDQGLYNLLIGNGGNTLNGGFGRRNILVAGGGASTLNAGDGEDLLIGGFTMYDTDPALTSWLQIAAYWAGADGNTDDYATRVANLMSGNGVPLLDATTVTGNGGGNTMTGNGALALIYSDGQDNIAGFDPNSTIVPISP